MFPNWPSVVENPDKFRCNRKCVDGSKKFSLVPKNTVNTENYNHFWTQTVRLRRFGFKTLNCGLLAVKNLAQKINCSLIKLPRGYFCFLTLLYSINIFSYIIRIFTNMDRSNNWASRYVRYYRVINKFTGPFAPGNLANFFATVWLLRLSLCAQTARRADRLRRQFSHLPRPISTAVWNISE